MFLTTQQAEDLYASAEALLTGIGKRRAVTSPKWPGGVVPYKIDENFNGKYAQEFEMQEKNNFTSRNLKNLLGK